jgi:hypothetical protein
MEPPEVERIGSRDRNNLYAVPGYAPPQQPLPGFAPPQQPLPGFAPAASGEQEEKKHVEFNISDYDASCRRFAIILSVSAMALTIVALFALPLDFNSFDRTLLRVGMMGGETVVMALTIVALVVGLISLIMPMCNVVTGALLVAASYMAYNDLPALFGHLSSPGFIVFILLAVYIIVLGMVSTLFMKKFIDNNADGVPLFKACYLTWTGIPHN